jgi:hypothetical protein
MVFSATFNTISAIYWRSVLLVEETGGPRENQLFSNQNICILFLFVNIETRGIYNTPLLLLMF